MKDFSGIATILTRCSFFAVALAIWIPSTSSLGQDPVKQLTVIDKEKAQQQSMFVMQLLRASYSGSTFGGEIELLDYQKAELTKVSEEYRQSMQKLIEEMTETQTQLLGGKEPTVSNLKSIREELIAKHFQQMKSLCESTIAKAEKVLVDDQVKRLKQLAVQFECAMNSGEGFELLAELKPKVSLSPDDSEKLSKAIDEAKKEYRRELGELRERLNRRVLKVLDQDSRDKLQAAIGDFYYFDEIK